MDHLKARIDLFLKAADEMTAAHFVASGFTHSKPPTHRADYISDKWARIVVMEDRGGTEVASSVYAFIALADFSNKTLGKVNIGGIHKAAGFKAAAKHERGNVLHEDFRKCLTPYGIVYLK
jgi:hypothetical protein